MMTQPRDHDRTLPRALTLCVHLVAPRHAEPLLGDLEEDLRRSISKLGPRRARRRLWRQALRSLPYLVWEQTASSAGLWRPLSKGLVALVACHCLIYAALLLGAAPGSRPLGDLPYPAFLVLWLVGAHAIAGFVATVSDRTRASTSAPLLAVLGLSWVLLATDHAVEPIDRLLWLASALLGTYLGRNLDRLHSARATAS